MHKRVFTTLFFLLNSIWFSDAKAYVNNRTSSDALVHWSNNVSLIDIFVNPANTQGYPTNMVQDQVGAAIAEWNGKSRISLRQNSTAGTNQQDLNEVYFSTDSSVFNGTGVVGVTQVYFKNNTGEILEADILINDNFTFSTVSTDTNFLGNVITHEMGHFLGLGHSQVSGSTMFYALSRGQSTIDADDKAGVYSIYPFTDATKGTLTGKVVGGKSLISVFGAHVQAISLKTGKVAASAISDSDGTFSIAGLDRGDQYYLYTSPIAQVGLPSKYNSVRNNFCSSSTKYRGSFFQACGSSSEGHPQAVKLNSSSVAVGNITIRCGLDTPSDYMQGKGVTPATYDIQSNVLSGIGNSFTGFFSNQEMGNSSKDYFRFNLSNITDWSSINASDDLYVELKVINQPMYSPFKAVVGIKRNSSNIVVTPKYVQETDGWINIDTLKRIQINRADPSDNDFEISVTPVQVDTPSSGLPYIKNDYFPASNYFEDPLYFYLVSASIVKDNGNGTYTLVSSKNDSLADNSLCPDALNTYALSNYTVNGSSSSGSKKRDGGIACGTVDMNGSSGSGPGGFFIGLIFSLLLCNLTSSIIRNKDQNKIAR